MVKKSHFSLQKWHFGCILIGIVFVAIFINSRTPKQPELGFSRQLFNPNEFRGDIPGVFDTTISHTEKQVEVAIKRGDTSLSFQLPIEGTTVSEKKNLLAFSSPNNTITTEYRLLSNGIKEDIILNKIPQENTFPSTLKTQGLITKITSEGIPVFYDKTNTYQYHFERPFVKDAKGAVSYDVKYKMGVQSQENDNDKDKFQFTKKLLSDSQTINQTSNTYVLIVEVDSAWLHDPKRVLPITIDPTVVHNTTSTFATGTLDGTTDTGSGASPVLQSYYQELTVNPSTVALWHMNENSGGSIFDSSGNGHTGTFSGPTWVTGKLGSGLNFNGNSVALGTWDIASQDKPFSVFMWINTTQVGVAGDFSLFFSKRDGSNTFSFDLEGGNIRVSNWMGVASGILIGSRVVNDGQWHNIGFTWDGSLISLYVDGNLDDSMQMSLYTQNIGNGNSLGAFDSGTTRQYIGSMDEVSFTNTVLSLEEIKENSSRRPSGTYISPIIDLGIKATAWNSFTWSESGVATGYGETPFSTTGLVAQWNLNDRGGAIAVADLGTCGATCNGSLSGFSNTSSSDIVPGSGWTAINQRWGAGATMFDGVDDRISIADTAALDIVGNITLETWIKPSVLAPATAGGGGFILAKASAYYLEQSNNGKIRVYFNGLSAPGYHEGNILLKIGDWNHVVTTYNGSAVSIYINGILDKTVSATGTITNTAPTTLDIGKYSGGGYEYRGLIDSSRIYSRALSATEILSNYNSSNIEFQTRVGNTTDPNDGTWEAWKPTTGESQISSLDSYTQIQPNSIANLGLWLKADAQVLSNGAAVSTWTDSSGNARNFTQGTAAQQPIYRTNVVNGQPAVNFTAVNSQTMTNATDFSSPSTVIYVSRQLGGTSGRMLSGLSNNWLLGYHGGFKRQAYFAGWISSIHDAPSDTNWHIYTSTHNGVFSNAYEDGNLYANGTNGVDGPNGVSLNGYLATSEFSDGDIAEVIVYSRVLNDVERSQIESYLANKYALTINGPPLPQVNTLTKIEGAGSYKLQSSTPINDSGTIGLWHLDETGGSGAYLHDSGYIAPTINLGTGADGDCVMNNGSKSLDTTVGSTVCNSSARSTAYAVNFSVTGTANIGDTSVTVSTTPTGLVAGDEFIIINLKGTSTNYNNVGLYETHVISSISTNTLNFTDSTLRYTYDGTTQKIMVQRIPQFGNVTVCGGNTGSGCTAAASLTTTAWNGTKGGVIFFRSTGTVTTNSGGTITADVGGYAGGATGQGAYGGETYNGAGGKGGTTATLGGAGQGGGGGAGGNITGPLGGTGSIGGAGGGGGTYGGGGGGGGGYATVGVGGTGTNSGGNGSIVTGGTGGASSTYAGGGGGGGMYGLKNLSKLFLGSGGGGGGLDDTSGAWGGNGGGIIYISANTIAPVGLMRNFGGNGTNAVGSNNGGGGGGAGGSTYLTANTVTLGSSVIYANGGSGGTKTGFGNVGGSGGSGRIAVYSTGVVSGTTSPSYFGLGSSNGTPTGTTLTRGITQNARVFNGTSDYINMNNPPQLQITGTLTVEAWIKTSASSAYRGIVGKMGAGSGTYGYLLRENSSSYAAFGVSSNGTAWTEVVGNTPINDDKWHHIVGTYLPSTSLAIYVDGILQNNNFTSIPASINNSTSNLILGCTYTTPSECMSGTIDEVRISDVVRSAFEIGESYRMRRNEFLNLSLTTTDLSTKNTIPFYVAADRPGTYLSTAIGESNYANYQPDPNTIGLWHMEEENSSWTTSFPGATIDTASWAEIDPAANKISQSSGLILSAGAVAAWDSAIISKAIYNRLPGLQIYGKFTTGAGVAAPNHMMIGFGQDQIASATHTNISHALYFNAGAFYVYQDGVLTGGPYGSGYVAATAYEIRITLNPGGRTARYEVKGGVYTTWTTLLAADNPKNNSPLRLHLAQYQHTGTLNMLRMNKPGSIIDSSSAGNLATSSGTLLTGGKLGKARSFDGGGSVGGSEYIDIQNSTAFDVTDFSIDSWVYSSNFNQYGFIFEKGSVNTQYSLFIAVTSGIIQRAYNSGGTQCMNVVTTLTDAGVIDNSWNHIVSTYDGNNLKLYINGILKKDTAVVCTLRTGQWGERIGAYGGTAPLYFFNGIIDEVRVSNIARTAEEIRAAYEVGLRSHPITINFGAKLDSGNLIANSGDLSFTIDATVFGLNQKGSAIYSGDKIIVRENYDGIEYIAQGLVNSVTSSTGALTVVSWDVGSTFPAGGFTVNADVFKWQREYWNITGSMYNQRNAVNQLTLRLTDGNEGRTVWLDDLKLSGSNLTIPTGSTITSSFGNRYFQYRSIFHSSDEAVSANLTSVSLNYNTNTAPAIPILNSPPTGSTNIPLIPTLQTTSTDPELDYLQYKIEFCTNLAMTVGCVSAFDQTASQAGWSGQNAQTNTAYASGMVASYTLGSALANNTTYYWRSYVKDPDGTNAWTSTQAAPFSFTTTVFNGGSSATGCKVTRTNNTNVLEWTDNTTNETGYAVQRNVNNGGWVDFNMGLSPNAVSLVDSTILANTTYQYRIAPFVSGPLYGGWCTISTQSIQTGTVEFGGGFNFSGFEIN